MRRTAAWTPVLVAGELITSATGIAHGGVPSDHGYTLPCCISSSIDHGDAMRAAYGYYYSQIVVILIGPHFRQRDTKNKTRRDDNDRLSEQ